MIYVFLTMTQFQIVSIKSNSIINKVMLKEIKHRKKVIINRSNKMQLQLNDCETEYIQKTQFLKKKVHLSQNKQTLRQPNQYQQIGMLPEYKLTIHQMNEDPISLVMRLQQKYRDYGAVKLVPPMEWNPPFQFKYTEKLITTRIQKIHRLIDGKVSLFHRQVP